MADTHQKFPSTAHYENGVWVHDPLNMPLAEAEKQGKLGAQPMEPREHISAIKGYCEHKVLGGCPRD